MELSAYRFWTCKIFICHCCRPHSFLDGYHLLYHHKIQVACSALGEHHVRTRLLCVTSRLWRKNSAWTLGNLQTSGYFASFRDARHSLFASFPPLREHDISSPFLGKTLLHQERFLAHFYLLWKEGAANKLPFLCLLGTGCLELPVRITQILASYQCRGLADTFAPCPEIYHCNLFEHCHHLVLSLFSLDQNKPSYSLSSNLVFFCLLVSRSLSPRNISWLHILQINISLCAGVGQNSSRKEPPEKSLSSSYSPTVLRQWNTIKGTSFQPPHWKNRQKRKCFLRQKAAI